MGEAMERNKEVLKHVDKSGLGIEIGPLASPKAPKRDGYKVHVIDHLSREQLLQKYKGHNLDLSKIEEVDYIWNGESYSALTGNHKHYDWLIASHVIEHTPDMIGFLNNCSDVLKDTGIISLVVPDKRFCFDFFRSPTGIARIIDAHRHKYSRHTPGAVAEHLLNAVKKDKDIVWSPGRPGELKLIHNVELVKRKMTDAENGAYVDGHVWCFTPHSFRLMIQDLYDLGLLSVCEVDFEQANKSEFYMTLGRKGRGCPMPRIELLETVAAESAPVGKKSRWIRRTFFGK